MAAQDRIPDRLGPYRLRERIGEGGMGAVYLARDRERRMVAVKVLHSRVAEEPTARRRLAREVEVMRRVRSPYVAEVLDADVTGKFPYIVTRYVPGHTLDEVVRQQGPLPPWALERLARGLAQALVAVHAVGVVHRDLKPGNVMLHDGDPVVIDFGIAHTGDATRLTQTGMFMGTPGFLAPEVIEGQPSTQASDVHSWGATIAYAATGRPPFGRGSFENIFYRIVQGDADLAGIPGPLVQLVSAALSRDPRSRPTAAWLTAQCASPGLAQGPPVLRGATTQAPVAGNGVAYGGPGAAAAGAYGSAGAYGGPGGGYGGAGALNAAGAAAPHAPRAPQPIRAADYADLLPPVQYAPARSPQPRPAVAAPHGSVQGGGYAPGHSAAPARGGDAGAVRPGPASPPSPPASQRAQPSPLLGLAIMVIAIAVSVMLPVAGTIGALAVIILLRAGDRAQSALTVRRSVRGPSAADILVGVVTAPWAIARSVLTMALLAPLAALVAAVVFVGTLVMSTAGSTSLAGSYAAGAAVALYGIGPASAGPRREINRVFRVIARTRASSTVVTLVMFCLAAAAVAAAAANPPLYWPNLGSMLPHLPNVSILLHLPHFTLPHFGVGPSRLG
jgi:serine/threonine kinase PknH